MRWALWIAVRILLVAGLTRTAWASPDHLSQGRTHVVYWEKWTGFEKEAIQILVDDFNRSQDRVFFDLVSVAVIRRNTLLATAGSNPPDLAGLPNDSLVGFSDKHAPRPL